MQVAVILLIAIYSLYAACYKPAWMWFAWLLGPVLFVIMFLVDHSVNMNGTNAGSVALRPFDGAILGMLVGIVYHVRREGFRGFFQEPGGRAILVFLGFIILKTVASVLLFSDEIFQGRATSHIAGGLVAAVGEVRDNMNYLFPALYVYAVPKSRDLKTLAWPFFTTELLLLLEWVVGVVKNGHIWTGGGNPFERPMDATCAICLTEFSLIFLFLRVPRLSTFVTRSIAWFGIIVATLANHRSQWLALTIATVVLATVALLGRPIIKQYKLGRVVAAGFFLLSSVCIAAFSYVSDLGMRFPLLDVLTVRMYAFTNPGRDPDSQWRQNLWTDRVQKVGGNWPWGRPFGARSETLWHGTWVTAPDHSAYVNTYEMGGVILSAILIVYFAQMIQAAGQQLITKRNPAHLWPVAVGLSCIAGDLAFGTAYSLPLMSPALIVILLVGKRSAAQRTLSALNHPYTQPLQRSRATPSQSPALG